MRQQWYKLDGKTPVPCGTTAEAFKGDRHVAQTNVGPLHVSTVFLGLDHRLMGEGPPLLFETMIFPGDSSGEYQERCSTWDEAEAQHAEAVAHARRTLT